MVDTVIDKEYTRSVSESRNKINCFPEPELAAAHVRTDIVITEEMRKHDDDIMDDENF